MKTLRESDHENFHKPYFRIELGGRVPPPVWVVQDALPSGEAHIPRVLPSV
jgi:hypothetical protein